MRIIVRPPGSAGGPSPRAARMRRRGGPGPSPIRDGAVLSFDGAKRAKHGKCGKLAKGDGRAAAPLASAA